MAKKTEIKCVTAKMVEVDGQLVPCTVWSSPKVRTKTKMKTRGKQTHNMNLDCNRWSRGV